MHYTYSIELINYLTLEHLCRQGLEFHKAAGLTWTMAGGAESDEEYWSADEEGSVNTAALRNQRAFLYSLPDAPSESVSFIPSYLKSATVKF